MAITKTSVISVVKVTPLMNSSAEDTANAKHPSIILHYFDTYTEDGVEGRPITRMKEIHKFVEDGGAATDVSGEDALVQTIATAIWG